MQKSLIIIGISILLIGLCWPVILKLQIGRLPGDIFINKPGIKVFIPVTTMILLSVILSLIMWFLKK